MRTRTTATPSVSPVILGAILLIVLVAAAIYLVDRHYAVNKSVPTAVSTTTLTAPQTVNGVTLTDGNNVVENIKQISNLSILDKAFVSTDLNTVLTSKGPFTVFAPSDQAFNALPQGKLEQLLKPVGKDQLSQIITYNIVPGSLHLSDLTNGKVLPTINGQTVTVSVDDKGRILVGGSYIKTADIPASNGVIFIIDSVLQPVAVTSPTPAL